MKQERFDDVMIIREYWERVNAKNKKGGRRSGRNVANTVVPAAKVQENNNNIKVEKAPVVKVEKAPVVKLEKKKVAEVKKKGAVAKSKKKT